MHAWGPRRLRRLYSAELHTTYFPFRSTDHPTLDSIAVYGINPNRHTMRHESRQSPRRAAPPRPTPTPGALLAEHFFLLCPALLKEP